MIEYLICFGVSCFLIYLIRDKKSKSMKFVVGSIIALSLPCALAAFRAEQIGTDVRGYINPLFDVANESKNIGAYWAAKYWAGSRYRYVNEYEAGFNLLVYFSAKVINSKQFLLGAIQILTITPVYLGLKRFEVKIPLWFGMLVYYLMHYNVTLNAMRQWIAMAFLFYAFKDLLQKRYCKYLVFIFISLLFHNSALIGVFFIAMRIFFDKLAGQFGIKIGSQIKLSSYQVKALLLAAACCIVFFVPQIILIMLKLVGLSDYSHYFYHEGTHFAIKQIIVRLPMLILFIINSKRLKGQMDYKVLLGIAICDIVFCNYVSGAEYMYRVAVWFSGYGIYAYPLLVQSLGKRNRRYAKVAVIAYLAAYWWYYYCFKGTNETVPYLSIWG